MCAEKIVKQRMPLFSLRKEIRLMEAYLQKSVTA